jgi:hypothetical protein
MRIELSLDEFTDLKMRPHAGADRVFHQAAKDTIEKLFPDKKGVRNLFLRSDTFCRPGTGAWTVGRAR